MVYVIVLTPQKNELEWKAISSSFWDLPFTKDQGHKPVAKQLFIYSPCLSTSRISLLSTLVNLVLS